MARPEVAAAVAVAVVEHSQVPIVAKNAAAVVVLVAAEPAVGPVAVHVVGGPDAALAAGFVAVADVAAVADADDVVAAVVPASAHSAPAQHPSNRPCWRRKQTLERRLW